MDFKVNVDKFEPVNGYSTCSIYKDDNEEENEWLSVSFGTDGNRSPMAIASWNVYDVDVKIIGGKQFAQTLLQLIHLNATPTYYGKEVKAENATWFLPTDKSRKYLKQALFNELINSNMEKFLSMVREKAKEEGKQELRAEMRSLLGVENVY